MTERLEKKVAGKETIEHLKRDLQFYSTRDLRPEQIYLLITETEEYKAVDEEIILLTIEQVLGKNYISKIKGEYNPESTPLKESPIEEIVKIESPVELKPKVKKKMSGKKKAALAILLIPPFLGLMYLGGRFGYEKLQKFIERQRQLKMNREAHAKLDMRIPREVYLGPVICPVCHGRKKESCKFCQGTGYYGKQMATVLYDGFDNPRDTINRRTIQDK